MSPKHAEPWQPPEWLRDRMFNSLDNVAGMLAILRSTRLQELDKLPGQFFAWLGTQKDVPELIMTALLVWSLYRIMRLVVLGFLWFLGFRSAGVMKGSAAARYQSRTYGGYVPRGSGFSGMQARGATESGFLGTKTLFMLCLVAVTLYASSLGS